jgi:hypothetical protein
VTTVTASVKVRSNHTLKRIRGVKAAGGAAVDLAAKAIFDEAERRVKRGKTLDVLNSLAIKRRYGDADTVAVGFFDYPGGRPVPRWLEMGTVRQHPAPALRPGAAMGRRVLKLQAEALVRAECNSDG